MDKTMHPAHRFWQLFTHRFLNLESNRRMRILARLALPTLALLAATTALAQRELPIQAPDDSQYSRKFFTQLRGVFGRFRETDLQRAFEKAQPIQCSELINGEGEWRTVAFFNEKRELGD